MNFIKQSLKTLIMSIAVLVLVMVPLIVLVIFPLIVLSMLIVGAIVLLFASLYEVLD